jgi:hypothetical protein
MLLNLFIKGKLIPIYDSIYMYVSKFNKFNILNRFHSFIHVCYKSLQCMLHHIHQSKYIYFLLTDHVFKAIIPIYKDIEDKRTGILKNTLYTNLSIFPVSGFWSAQFRNPLRNPTVFRRLPVNIQNQPKQEKEPVLKCWDPLYYNFTLISGVVWTIVSRVWDVYNWFPVSQLSDHFRKTWSLTFSERPLIRVLHRDLAWCVR